MKPSLRWLSNVKGKGLDMLISSVYSRHIDFSAEDVYKLCALLKAKEDVLQLKSNADFIRGLRVQYEKLDPNTVTPFQSSFIEGALTGIQHVDVAQSPQSPSALGCMGVEPYGSVEKSADSCVSGKLSSSCVDIFAQKGLHLSTSIEEDTTIGERIAAIHEVVNESQKSHFIGSDGMEKIRKHCKALELKLRQMKPHEIASLVRALAIVNYQDYAYTNLLARRSCEIASKLSVSELCKTYFNLSKLQSHDSLVAFVNQIESQMEKLHQEQLQFVFMALERQPQIAFAPARMVPKLLTKAASLLCEVSDGAFYRSMLVVAARYNQRRHPAVGSIMSSLPNHVEGISDRDLLAILQSIVDLELSTNVSGMSALLGRITVIADTVDIRSVDTLLDILSVLPCDTQEIMEKLLNRLVEDAGKLSIPQVVSILDLLSSYPPAKGHACVASLSFAASLRAEFFDGEALENIVVNLGQLTHFSDDFYMLVGVLQNAKGGFRAVDKLFELLRFCTRDVASDVRGQDMITKGILGLAPTMNDENLSEVRRILLRLGVDDKNVHQMILRRAKQIQRESGGRWGSRANYTPDGMV
uniref:Uncharacterized protein TCIL3000_10_8290 n=1 Tax=Trypanosoma congolense (strain IL3000) TaxID=1068625 RepID=G0UXD6_TRYCI|nr:unnamed protein product [Trypanosoma congolense IL3000]